MAIETITSLQTCDEQIEIVNDNFIEHEGRLNEVDEGVNAFSTTSASFVQPAVSASVSVTVDETGWMGVGQPLYMVTGGNYVVASVTDITTVVLTNLGYSGNATVGATVASGKKVSPSGFGDSGGATPDATETVKGKAEIATQAETDTGTDDTRIVTPLKLANYSGLGGGGGSAASETVAGIAELATQTETDTGTDDARIVTPLKLASRTSTETRAGVVELATDAETQTGTDTARAITPANLSARSATETRTGIAEIATQAETDTGTDDARIVTALKAATRYLAKAGGTLTGFLTLHADPSSAMHAVTKQYADALTVGGAPPASETTAGIAEIATQTETDTGTDDARIVTPLKLANYSGLGGGSGYRTLLTVASDVTITGTSFSDVTGLTFSVTSGTNYRFQAIIDYDASASTVGAAGSVNGPASPTILSYYVMMTGSSGAVAHFQNNTYNDATRLQTASRDTNNLCLIQGIIRPSASGTFAIRFATEATGTITVKAGSTLEWW